MVVSHETKEWINDRYRDWRNKQPREADTITAFARYLDVSRNSLNNWMNRGKTPDPDSALKLSKVGIEIYDLLKLKRPDAKLLLVMRNWDYIPDDVKVEVAEEAARAEARGIVEPSDKRVEVSKRRRAPSN